MAEAVGSASFTAGWPGGQCNEVTFASLITTSPTKENAAFPRRSHIAREAGSNYFDTDFLNMRSIFSLVASQQAWLA